MKICSEEEDGLVSAMIQFLKRFEAPTKRAAVWSAFIAHAPPKPVPHWEHAETVQKKVALYNRTCSCTILSYQSD